MMIFDSNGSISKFQESTHYKEIAYGLKNSDPGKFYCIGDWNGFEKDKFYDIKE